MSKPSVLALMLDKAKSKAAPEADDETTECVHCGGTGRMPAEAEDDTDEGADED